MDDNKRAHVQNHKYNLVRFAIDCMCDFPKAGIILLETYVFNMQPKTIELLGFADKLKKALLIHRQNYQTMILDVRSIDPEMADMLDEECNRKFNKSGR